MRKLLVQILTASVLLATNTPLRVAAQPKIPPISSAPLAAALPPATTAMRIERLSSSSSVLPLTKGWRYHSGDNPAWARPDFDDSAWDTLNPTRPRQALPPVLSSGISWLRLRFRLGDSLRQESLLLTAWEFGAAEVYLNGRLLLRQGQLHADPTQVQPRGRYPRPGIVPANGTAEQVLAVRLAPWQPALPNNFGKAPLLAVNLHSSLAFWDGYDKEKSSALIDLVLLGFAGLLAVLHYAFYHYNPARSANRYFARFALVAALAAGGGYATQVLPLATFTAYAVLNALSDALALMVLLWAVRALYALFDVRPGRVYASLWLAYAGYGLVAFLGLFTSVPGWSWVLMLVLLISELLRLTIQAQRQGQRGAGLVTAGFTGAGLIILVLVAHVFVPMLSSPVYTALVALGFMLSALGISLYLAREFAHDAQQLQLKLSEVKTLSAQARAQEQDKQALLAQQNETLEAQVQRRTTELQQSLTELRATQERLGQLDAAKNQFFANVSHELRTPLTLVLGPLDGLLTASPLPAAVREPVALAHRSARRLQEMVNRILDLTKLQAGRLALHPVPTAVAPLLRRVVTQFESLAAERRVTLVAPRALPDDLRLQLDADKVEQILTNLLINALNHTPAGGAVTVSAALLDATGHYVLTVRDTGPGIALAEQARVFERFYQSPQRQAQGGTGLGLALSRELATLLGGTLTLLSEPGQGAAFTLRFPALVLPAEVIDAEEPDEDLSAARGQEKDEVGAGFEYAGPSSAAGSRPRVLVVEDQPDLRAYLHQLLAPAYEVLTATDGQDALDVLAREAPVDLVTTDAMMPRLSGTELLAHLKADPARAGLPVLMLTARADETHRLTSLTVGVDDYLTKPFVPAELLARVAALLHRHTVRRQFASQPSDPLAFAPAELLARATEPAEPATTAGPTTAAPLKAYVAGTEQLTQWQTQIESFLVNPDFGPAELAGLLCLSERTLYRRLGELAGLTPAAWLRELRLDRARQLLEAGNFESVADVADAAGFVNAKSFAARYAERFGRRPHTYRT